MQVKSHFYYLFWLIMAAAVVGGQLYVGSGYRIMSRELRSFTQGVYDAQMGWDARQQYLEQKAQGHIKSNRTYELE